MIQRWTFYFDQENIRSDVSNPIESDRIKDFINCDPKGMLELPGVEATIYMNLSMVKCIVKVPVTDEQLAAEKAQAVEPAAVENV